MDTDGLAVWCMVYVKPLWLFSPRLVSERTGADLDSVVSVYVLSDLVTLRGCEVQEGRGFWGGCWDVWLLTSLRVGMLMSAVATRFARNERIVDGWYPSGWDGDNLSTAFGV